MFRPRDAGVAGTVGGSTYGVAKGMKLYADGRSSTAPAVAPRAGSSRASIGHQESGAASRSQHESWRVVLTSDERRHRGFDAGGVVYSVAAGKYGMDACQFSPASATNALTVGATTRKDARAYYSNIGSCVDLFAPGDSIVSAWYTSDTGTNTLRGTSMAAPHVTGVAALYLEGHPSGTPAEVAQALLANATSARLTNVGTGSPNLLLYVGTASAPAPCTSKKCR